MKELIKNKSDFDQILQKLEIRAGQIIEVEEIKKSYTLIKLKVDFEDETRTVVTNIKPYFENINDLLDKVFAFIVNLEPAKIMGIESTAMILPGEIEKDKIIMLNCQPGTRLL